MRFAPLALLLLVGCAGSPSLPPDADHTLHVRAEGDGWLRVVVASLTGPDGFEIGPGGTYNFETFPVDTTITVRARGVSASLIVMEGTMSVDGELMREGEVVDRTEDHTYASITLGTPD